MLYMHLLEIDKYEYKLNENLIVTIKPGRYIDSCFGLKIQNLDTDQYMKVPGFYACKDVITTIKEPQIIKILLNGKLEYAPALYTPGRYKISVQADGKDPEAIKFNIL